MLRENYNNDGIVKEYKNGNITIKYYEEGIKESKKDSVLIIGCLLEMLDCYFVGETYCLSNYATGHSVYNCYSDKMYIFAWNDIEKLEAGKTIRLYARKIDETDKEILKEEGYGYEG